VVYRYAENRLFAFIGKSILGVDILIWHVKGVSAIMCDYLTIIGGCHRPTLDDEVREGTAGHAGLDLSKSMPNRGITPGIRTGPNQFEAKEIPDFGGGEQTSKRGLCVQKVDMLHHAVALRVEWNSCDAPIHPAKIINISHIHTAGYASTPSLGGGCPRGNRH